MMGIRFFKISPALIALTLTQSAYSKTPRSLPTIKTQSVIIQQPKEAIPPPNFTLSLGMNYVFPELHYQQRLDDNMTLGITSVLIHYPFSTGNTLRGYSGRVTLNYFPDRLWDGMWLQPSLGVSLLSATNKTNTEALTLPTVSLLFGWYWREESGISWGFGAGGQYLLNAKASQMDLGFNGFWPSVVFELGFGL